MKTIIYIFVISCLGCVIDKVPKSDNKVTICHKGKTIHVAESAVKAHLKHGDYIGYCK
jgi:hypothetical protein